MKRYLSILLAVPLLASLCGVASSQQRTPTPDPIPGIALAALPDPPLKPEPGNPKKYPRGHATPTPAVLAARHADAAKRHDSRVLRMRQNMQQNRAIPDSFDCRTQGWVGPVQDQGQCGSCWDVSACGVVTNAFIKVGLAKNDGSFILSPQYVLDCGQNGGCNGDDAPTVLDMAKSKGLPTAADYGPYTASPGNCKLTNQKLYQIKDWGFCTANQQQGIASTADIKTCLLQYGALSTAVAANGDWDSYSGGIMSGDSFSVNHDVSIIGWKMQGTTTIWLVLNQWGDSWGEKGCCWIPEGKYQIGTEGAWASVGELPPPPPPPPVPPDPPPGPPTPAGPISSITVNMVDGSTQQFYPLTSRTTLGELSDILKGAPTMREPPLASPILSDAARWAAQEEMNKVMMEAIRALQKQVIPPKP